MLQTGWEMWGVQGGGRSDDGERRHLGRATCPSRKPGAAPTGVWTLILQMKGQTKTLGGTKGVSACGHVEHQDGGQASGHPKLVVRERTRASRPLLRQDSPRTSNPPAIALAINSSSSLSEGTPPPHQSIYPLPKLE